MYEFAVIAVILAFAFTFTNGFQDASTIAATFIASRSAAPKTGIILVAGMSFCGAVGGGSAVAFTLAGLLTLQSDAQVVLVVLAALVTATAWNLITWKFALPSSSTHSLVGGLIGAGIAAAGTGCVLWGFDELAGPAHELSGVAKILIFFAVSLLIGFIGSYGMRKGTQLLLRNAERSANRKIIGLNWCLAAVMAFSNGANDTQKQMGIIAMVLVASGLTVAGEIPVWTRVACAILIALGTIGGGWRIMNTLGRRIFRIEPVHSFDSQAFSAASIALSTVAGAPVSSTQIITMSVLGVGAAENPRKVKWDVGKHILVSMVITIPVTILLAGAIYLAAAAFTGV